MRSVHSPPPPAAAGEKPPGHRLGPSPPLTERRASRAAPQRASRRAPRRPAAGRSTQRRGWGACGQRCPPPAGRQWGSPAEAPAAAAVRVRPRQPEAARPCPAAPAPPPPGAAPPLESSRRSLRPNGTAALLSSPPSSGDSGTGGRGRPFMPRPQEPPTASAGPGRAGLGWAGPGEVPPRRPVLRGSGGERDPLWGGSAGNFEGSRRGGPVCPRRPRLAAADRRWR